MMKRPNQHIATDLAFSRFRGFTLLEVMVVVLIIGLIMTFASLTIGGRADEHVHQEAKRFTGLMQLAVDSAVLDARELVVQLNKTSYDFFTLSAAGEIDEIKEEGTPFRRRTLPEGLELKAEIDGVEVFLSDEEEQDNPALVFIFSSGEMTPFDLEVRTEDEAGYHISGDFSGNIELKGKDE